MTAEQYLEQTQKINDIIVDKLKERRRWVDIAEGLGGFNVSDRVQSSRNLHRGADAIGEYCDIDREIKALEGQKNSIMSDLQKLPLFEYRVLYKIYVEGYMLKELPSEFHKSYAWVKMKKRRGLDILQEIIDRKGE
jgi:DNA-directed RNA polymerase specialized sigma24 family protein